MPLKFDLRDVAETAGRVAVRFWPVLLLAFGAWLAAMGLIWRRDLPESIKAISAIDERLGKAIIIFVIGVAGSLTACILGERATGKIPGLRYAWIALSFFFTALILWWFWQMEPHRDWIFLRLIALNGCAHLLVAAAPFLGKGSESGFWQYNRILFIRLFTGVLYTATLFIGLLIAYVVTCELFGYEEKGETIGTLGVTLAFIFHTWYFLAGIPGKEGAPAAELPQPTWQSLDGETT